MSKICVIFVNFLRDKKGGKHVVCVMETHWTSHITTHTLSIQLNRNSWSLSRLTEHALFCVTSTYIVFRHMMKWWCFCCLLLIELFVLFLNFTFKMVATKAILGQMHVMLCKTLHSAHLVNCLQRGLINYTISNNFISKRGEVSAIHAVAKTFPQNEDAAMVVVR